MRIESCIKIKSRKNKPRTLELDCTSHSGIQYARSTQAAAMKLLMNYSCSR